MVLWRARASVCCPCHFLVLTAVVCCFGSKTKEVQVLVFAALDQVMHVQQPV